MRFFKIYICINNLLFIIFIILVFTLDIAIDGDASQSSRYDSRYKASVAIDGVTKTDPFCAHTLLERNPFWLLQFDALVEIFMIKITNVKEEVNRIRLNDFTLFIGNTSNTMFVCTANKDMSELQTAEYECDDGPMVGKFFKIILNQFQYLVLCEVELVGAYYK